MKHTYKVDGMTCSSCVASVTDSLSTLDEVDKVVINLEKSEVEISMQNHIPLIALQKALPDKYSISTMPSFPSESEAAVYKQSKWQQLKPPFPNILLFIRSQLFTKLWAHGIPARLCMISWGYSLLSLASLSYST